MSKRPTDPNQLAKLIVDQLTGNAPPDTETAKSAAQMLGRLGGLKGGKARAAALSKTRRSEIAKKAAQVRWKTKGKTWKAAPTKKGGK